MFSAYKPGGRTEPQGTPVIKVDNQRDSVTVQASDPRLDPADRRGEVGAVTVAKPKLQALPFTSIGALSKEVLYGTKTRGQFVVDHKAGFATRTALGTSLSASSIRQGDALNSTVTVAHAFPSASVSASATSAGSADIMVQSTLAQGLRGSLIAGMAPGPVKSLSALALDAGAEYSNQYVHIKGTSSLTPQPVVSMSLGTGTAQMQFGLDLTFSTSRALLSARDAAHKAAEQRSEAGTVGSSKPAAQEPSRVAAMDAAALVGGLTKWTAALGYKHQDHHFALHVSDTGASPFALNTKLSYATPLQEGMLLGLEAGRNFTPGKAEAGPFPVSFSVGISSTLTALQEAAAKANRALDSDNSSKGEHNVKPASPSALVKCRLDDKGLLSFLYSDKVVLEKNPREAAPPTMLISWGAQLDTRNLFSRLPKVGVSLELL